MLGPPWTTPPDGWSIDGRRLRLWTPPVTDLVISLRSGESPQVGPVMGAVHTMISVTLPADRWRLVMWILDPDRPRSDRLRVQWIADDLVRAVTGWNRWTLTRVWEQAMGMWPIIDGKAAMYGVSVTDLPFHRATALVYSTLTEMHSQDGDHYSKWLDDLDRPPPRQVRREIIEATEAEAEAEFEAAAAWLAGFGAGGDDNPL